MTEERKPIPDKGWDNPAPSKLVEKGSFPDISKSLHDIIKKIRRKMRVKKLQK